LKGYTFFELLTSKIKNDRGLLIDEKEKEDEPGAFVQTVKSREKICHILTITIEQAWKDCW